MAATDRANRWGVITLLAVGVLYLVIVKIDPPKILGWPIQQSGVYAVWLRTIFIAWILLSAFSKLTSLFSGKSFLQPLLALVAWLLFFVSTFFGPKIEMRLEMHHAIVNTILFFGWPAFDLYDLWVRFWRRQEIIEAEDLRAIREELRKNDGQ